MATTYNVAELAAGLRAMLETEGCNDAIRVLCQAVAAAGAAVEIDEDDDDPDDLSNDKGMLWVSSNHRLMIEGEEVAEWTRCACGHYGNQGQRHLAASWNVEEDTDGGDRLPDAVAVALDALGLEDTIPDVPEPAEEEEDDVGEYAVLYKNDYAVSAGRDTWGVVSRHATREEAERACDARWRRFTAATTQGSYGPEWCVGVLLDCGKWQPIASDEE